ncbi:MAG TPA: M28 family peptidase, partial [Gammaproteobacteria bacterium]|nr:M28 family peptidase [Gammaproteobacteria bacterium]
RAFTLLEPRPARSVLFLATTSEEQGLLGAQYYADHPAIPLAHTVADINMDIMNVYGRSRDLMVIGWDKSGLQPLLASAAAKEGLRLEPYAHPETGMFYRTDLLEFARHGVPAIVTASGHDYVGRPAGWGDRQWAEYFADRYHKPADEFDPDWDLSGLVQQAQALFLLGAGLAEGDAWPDWNEGVPFKALRDRERPPAAASH